MSNRMICLVADSLGIGALPDAADFGDLGADTLGHTARFVGGIRLPNLEKLGLGHLGDFQGIKKLNAPIGVVARLGEKSPAKDTMTGHWEMAGVITQEPFPIFPKGFPPELIQSFISRSQVPGILGNLPASGTTIIDELGEEHLRTLKPIVYTSGDSVFQIAAHEKAFGLKRLYEICEMARELTLPYQIARVIARPFVGESVGSFKRTENRRDYSMSPPPNALDDLKAHGVDVYSVGKIEDIFAHRGVCFSNHTGNNLSSLRATEAFIDQAKDRPSFIFVNLVDFDMLYGHRRDPKGYATALEGLDAFLPRLIQKLGVGDGLMLTADHGCDPTYRGTDHTREYVPMVGYFPGLSGQVLADRSSFADIGKTVLDWFKTPSQIQIGSPLVCVPKR